MLIKKKTSIQDYTLFIVTDNALFFEKKDRQSTKKKEKKKKKGKCQVCIPGLASPRACSFIL